MMMMMMMIIIIILIIIIIIVIIIVILTIRVKIVYTIYLVNEGNFPITHTMMLVILKVSVKWCLFDCIPFNEMLVGWLVIVESRSKSFSTTRVLFWTCFTWKKIHNIFGTAVQIIGPNAIFTLGTERSKFFSGHNMFTYFAPSTSTWCATGAIFDLTEMSFNNLALLNRIIGTFSKNLFSLSGVNSKCI